MPPHSHTVAYYITPHGFGHAVRSLEIIRKLRERSREVRLIVVSDIPVFLVEQCVGVPLPYRRRRLDVGLVQRDSLRFDLAATREALERLRRDEDRLLAEEVDFLAGEAVSAIVSDVAFLPFLAAERRGIPSLGIGNFTWDWIYGSYRHLDSGWEPLIGWVREGYRRCGLFLELPMHGDCSVCPNRRSVPLVCRRASRDPSETQKLLGIDGGRRHYLVSFADLHLGAEAGRRLEAIRDARFLFKHPLTLSAANSRSLDGLPLSYADVVAAVDGVITKPGYGIVSDCLAHGTPMVYTDRGVFPEYEVLVEAIRENLASVYLPSEDLYAGRWQTALDDLSRTGRRTPAIRLDGADVCAEIILEELLNR